MASKALDDAQLFGAHESAARAADAALGATQTAGAAAAQQRSLLEAAVHTVQSLTGRARDARNNLNRTREALEQIRIVALNAGLEGARLGDPAGKPLLLVAEELKSQVNRAIGFVGDHDAALEQMDRDRDKLRDTVELAQQRSADLARDLLQAQASQRDVGAALASLAGRLGQVLETDAETARALAEAAESARALETALGNLAGKPQRAALVGALAPALAPLLQLLGELGRSGPGVEEP